MKKPYPGFAPNIKSVIETAGYKRSCMVVDILSLHALEPAEIAMLEEHLSAFLDKLTRIIPNIHRCELVTPDRFDKILTDGLRLE